MSTLSNIEFLFAAAQEGILGFDELFPLEDFRRPVDSNENSNELSCSFTVKAESAIDGIPVLAKVTVTVDYDGDWNFVAESGFYELVFETGGSLKQPKSADKAIEFISKLNLVYTYDPLEKPSNLEAELAAAFAGYLKRLDQTERRGGKLREIPIMSATFEEYIPKPTALKGNSVAVEDVLRDLTANDVLTNILRQGPAE